LHNDLKPLIKMAEANGAMVRDGKHMVLSFPNGRTVTVSKTPKGRHIAIMVERDILKALGQWPLVRVLTAPATA
jgi:hypothetical protein